MNIKNNKVIKFIWRVFLYGFALFGFGVMAAYGVFQLGWTNNKGGVDKNNRYLADMAKFDAKDGIIKTDKYLSENLAHLAILSRFYPQNAQLISSALSNENANINKMIAACEIGLHENTQYQKALNDLSAAFRSIPYQKQEKTNAIEWMNTPEWGVLKQAIVKDKALIDSAARLCGVEPRLIVGCLVGEQIRLFNSNRESYKRYIEPMKVLNVQSQFSLGVNGIKDFTAMAVESNLKNEKSEFYMGKRYEHILDFSTSDHTAERVSRLVNYHNHFYSFLYTGCILHQTALQWKRAGYSIDNRPDILITLFNIGFSESHPSANPECGGSHINVAGKIYTFGVIGFNFYYSGELLKEFPYEAKTFID
ncbi:MAG: hypothetical protein LBR28_02260 [Bacteroidales bacterium]|jgi:hypothetical protein|nr:hypothetical protein [Bacteroidales bacterium]